jgi:hypothetical protein
VRRRRPLKLVGGPNEPAPLLRSTTHRRCHGSPVAMSSVAIAVEIGHHQRRAE